MFTIYVPLISISSFSANAKVNQFQKIKATFVSPWFVNKLAFSEI